MLGLAAVYFKANEGCGKCHLNTGHLKIKWHSHESDKLHDYEMRQFQS